MRALGDVVRGEGVEPVGNHWIEHAGAEEQHVGRVVRGAADLDVADRRGPETSHREAPIDAIGKGDGGQMIDAWRDHDRLVAGKVPACVGQRLGAVHKDDRVGTRVWRWQRWRLDGQARLRSPVAHKQDRRQDALGG